MAENKEITTLHPYMNRNKNRYPNVKEENIPDTIQRKLTAGQGISISPDNVISATGGDSYTRSETDALLDTKADKVALENVNKAVPTDIAVKDGKLGLEHNTTWLTNQNAITLGDGLTYDEATKTLKASGGKGGISVIELTDKNGTIASTQLGEINANPQNFAFKYNGKILSFTSSDSTTYQYCNNTTNSSDNNVMTTSTLLTITSSTGVYTITENFHNVVANSIHPANGGDLTNIQVGSKVYSIPSGGGGGGPLYCHSITIQDGISINYYNSKSTRYTFDAFVNEITGKYLACYGIILIGEDILYIYKITGVGSLIKASFIKKGSKGDISINNSGNFFDFTYLVS